MATTKKSTKQKTKTAVPKVSKRSNAQTKKPLIVSTKTIKPIKPVATKDITTSKSAIKAKVTRKFSPLQQLQIISAIVFAGLAVASALLMNNRAYQLVTGFIAKDELASQTNTVFAPAVHSVHDLQLRYMVAVIMGLAAVTSVLLLTRLKKRYESSLKNRVHLWRWIDTAIVGALMVEVIAVVSGVQDIMTLKLLAGMVVLSGLLAWIAEKEHAENERPAKAAFFLSVLASLIPWIVIGVYAANTFIFGMIRNTWFVYALYGTTLLGFIAGAINLRYQLTRPRLTLNYLETERNYLIINLLTRTAFAVILILGLLK